MRGRSSSTRDKLRRADSWKREKEADVPLAIAGTGYGLIGILVIILLVVLIFYFVRRV
jgi:hypothetical protein